MRTIPLTQGKVALVDDADFEAVSQYKWRTLKTRRGFYAVRSHRGADGVWGTLLLHHFLMPGVPQIDHRDGNGLNNQRYNLRSATTQQNRQGFRLKGKNASSQFRGVCWHPSRKKWVAAITLNKKQIHIGYFTDETEAARAYDSAAIFYFGEWASTNFPIGDITIT